MVHGCPGTQRCRPITASRTFNTYRLAKVHLICTRYWSRRWNLHPKLWVCRNPLCLVRSIQGSVGLFLELYGRLLFLRRFRSKSLFVVRYHSCDSTTIHIVSVSVPIQRLHLAMAFAANSFPIDPDYGKIGPMCAYLGYTDQIGPRSQSILSKATITHRLEYMARSPSLTKFPTNEHAYEARECARTFVEANPCFFEDSAEAASSGFPIYPQDKNKYGIFRIPVVSSYAGLTRSTG